MSPALPADALPFAPFQGWIRTQVAIHGAEELALRAGVDESLIRRWLAGRYRHRGREQVIHRIPIDTADTVLTRVDDGETLTTLYPDLEPPRRGKGGGKPVGKYRLLSDDQVRAIHRIHIDAGVSIRELARQLHTRFGYSGEKSMANCLSAAFDSLGLDARDRVDAVRLTCTVHGRATREHRDQAWTRAGRVRRGEILDRPMCAAVRVQHPRKGQPCGNRALADSEFCWGHDPRYDELRRTILDDARQRLHGTSA